MAPLRPSSLVSAAAWPKAFAVAALMAMAVLPARPVAAEGNFQIVTHIKGVPDNLVADMANKTQLTVEFLYTFLQNCDWVNPGATYVGRDRARALQGRDLRSSSSSDRELFSSCPSSCSSSGSSRCKSIGCAFCGRCGRRGLEERSGGDGPVAEDAIVVAAAGHQPNRELQAAGGLIQAVYMGKALKPAVSFPLGICESTCMPDKECQAGLFCYKRRRNDPLPSPCTGASLDNDFGYCVPPLPTCSAGCTTDKQCATGKCYIRDAGQRLPPNCPGLNIASSTDFCGNLMGHCQGDCKDGLDCVSGMKCNRRVAGAPIPVGCAGRGLSTASATSYCVWDPTKQIPPTRPPTRAPTRTPTARPTRSAAEELADLLDSDVDEDFEDFLKGQGITVEMIERRLDRHANFYYCTQQSATNCRIWYKVLQLLSNGTTVPLTGPINENDVWTGNGIGYGNIYNTGNGTVP